MAICGSRTKVNAYYRRQHPRSQRRSIRSPAQRN
jgi:predicted RNA-binding Zn ribbon-like protein